MAPCEFTREMEAASLRRKDEAERDLVLAWSVAALSAQAQAGKLTPIHALLKSGEKAQLQSRRQEQRQMLMYLSDYHKIPLRTTH